MAFNVKFYKIDAPPNKLNKGVVPGTTATIGAGEGYDCTPWEPVGVLDGYVVLNYVQAIGTANYAYISGGTRPRYAFVTGYDIIPGEQMRVYVKEDPLMCFATEINKLPIYVTRTEQEATADNPAGYNVYIPDQTVQKTARTYTKVTVDPNIPKFEYPDSSLNTARQYILGVIG